MLGSSKTRAALTALALTTSWYVTGAHAHPASLITAATTTAAGQLASPLGDLTQAFGDLTGARLVFDRGSLPRGSYYAEMPALTTERRLRAAKILLDEARKYPEGYFKAIGLKTVGVFGPCRSSASAGHRGASDDGGTTYYGVWNGSDAVVACYYSDRQLPTTFHHEVFHAVDGAHLGVMSQHRFYRADDARFTSAISGKKPYPALQLAAGDLRALKRASAGAVLRQRVSDYAASGVGEDQAETARWLMSKLPDALVQMALQPELAGTQRMLHVIEQYRLAAKDGPGVDWFVNVALGRTVPLNDVAADDDADAVDELAAGPGEGLASGADAPGDADLGGDEVVAALATLASTQRLEEDDLRFTREALDWLAQAGDDLSTEVRAQAVEAAVALTPRLIEARIQPRGERFTVWVAQSTAGGNQTLRADVATFAADVERLGRLSGWATRSQVEPLARSQVAVLRMLARYRAFIHEQWRVSGATDAAFDEARATMIAAIPRVAESTRRWARAASWDELAGRASTSRVTTEPRVAPPATTARRPAANPHLAKVDAAVRAPAVRAAIRAVQPAAVKIGGGSGVNLLASGLILTNAHVAKAVGQRYTAEFPDGRRFTGRTIASNHHYDLALVELEGASDLPTAPIAGRAPRVNTPVVVIGQPGTRTPDGQATGYERFHVSTGHIRGFLDNPLGKQSLGRTKHDAWTYWGHSGSPIFGHDGAIVALHNSWDSSTAMRHAVTWQAIVRFLRDEGVSYEVR